MKKKTEKKKTEKKKQKSMPRSPVARSIEEARQKLAMEMGDTVEAMGRLGCKVIEEVGRCRELMILPKGCTSAANARVAAAKLMLEAAAIVGARAGKVEVSTDAKGGSITYRVIYSDAKPEHDEEDTGANG